MSRWWGSGTACDVVVWGWHREHTLWGRQQFGSVHSCAAIHCMQPEVGD